jgi:hypothetical protein
MLVRGRRSLVLIMITSLRAGDRVRVIWFSILSILNVSDEGYFERT